MAATAKTLAPKPTPVIGARMAKNVTAVIDGRASKLVPDFDGFAKSHPWAGQKVGPVTPLPNGYSQRFQVAIAYGAAFGAVFEVHGAILDHYLQLGGPAGLLGLPVTDELGCADGAGRYNHFEQGSIYWHPALGACEVHGAIRDKWAALGWEAFGYPMTDESSTVDGVGRFNHFRALRPDGSQADSSIYWHPQTGAFEVHGAIREAWANRGWEMGFLGYPVSDEYSVGAGRRSDFSHGSISYTDAMGAQVQPQRVLVDLPSIVFEDGVTVGGYASFEVFSDGTTHFRGHLHNSTTWTGYDASLGIVLLDSANNAYAAYKTGSIASQFSDNPNLDWDEWAHNDLVRSNWAQIWAGHSAGFGARVSSNLDFVDFIKTIVDVVLQVIDAMAQADAQQAGNPNYGPVDDYPDEGLAPASTGIQRLTPIR